MFKISCWPVRLNPFPAMLGVDIWGIVSVAPDSSVLDMGVPLSSCMLVPLQGCLSPGNQVLLFPAPVGCYFYSLLLGFVGKGHLDASPKTPSLATLTFDLGFLRISISLASSLELPPSWQPSSGCVLGCGAISNLNPSVSAFQEFLMISPFKILILVF